MKIIKIIFLNICVFLVLILLLEFFSFAFLSFQGTNKIEFNSKIDYVEGLGLIFNPEYYPPTTDRLDNDLNKASDNASFDYVFHAYGGSYTYGYGLEENQTYHHNLTQYFNNSISINYGLPGLGPIEAMYSVKKHFPYPESKAHIGLFYFIDDHINRANLNLSHCLFINPRSLSGVLENFEVLPLFKTNFFKYSLVIFINSTNIGKLFFSMFNRLSYEKNPDIYKISSDDDFVNVVKYIKHAKDQFISKYKNARFYVFTTMHNERIINFFKNNDLDLIFIDGVGGFKYLLENGHPTFESNQIVAKKLSEIIKKDLEITQHDE